MKIKKEILEMCIIFILGVLFILTMCWNAKQYDKKFPNQYQQKMVE